MELPRVTNRASLHQAMWEYRREFVILRLNECGLNISECARSLNVHRNTLVRIIRVSEINIAQMRRNWRLAGNWVK